MQAKQHIATQQILLHWNMKFSAKKKSISEDSITSA